MKKEIELALKLQKAKNNDLKKIPKRWLCQNKDYVLFDQNKNTKSATLCKLGHVFFNYSFLTKKYTT
ncbi:MAG TPA: hypothetical protein P5235_03315 [Saprospiraceae bacterium]|nr:hypothetical protein [Saprospiraceae bacterium]HRX28385.1 hypothetical protein [Saprospiraceae bacterium]